MVIFQFANCEFTRGYMTAIWLRAREATVENLRTKWHRLCPRPSRGAVPVPVCRSTALAGKRNDAEWKMAIFPRENEDLPGENDDFVGLN